MALNFFKTAFQFVRRWRNVYQLWVWTQDRFAWAGDFLSGHLANNPQWPYRMPTKCLPPKEADTVGALNLAELFPMVCVFGWRLCGEGRNARVLSHETDSPALLLLCYFCAAPAPNSLDLSFLLVLMKCGRRAKKRLPKFNQEKGPPDEETVFSRQKKSGMQITYHTVLTIPLPDQTDW